MNLAPIVNALPKKKIRVTFIDALTGLIMGNNKIKPDELPDKFDKPTTIQWNGVIWRVMRAEPITSVKFTSDNKLTLHIQDSALISSNLGFNVPTYCHEISVSDQKSGPNSDFELKLSSDTWRQLEFFPVSLLEDTHIQMSNIQEILLHEDNKDPLKGYRKIYLRDNIPQRSLNIQLSEFEKDLDIYQRGIIVLNNSLTDYSVIKTHNNTYYGLINATIIEELYLNSFDCIDEEIYNIMSRYNLLLADWCNTRIIMV